MAIVFNPLEILDFICPASVPQSLERPLSRCLVCVGFRDNWYQKTSTPRFTVVLIARDIPSTCSMAYEFLEEKDSVLGYKQSFFSRCLSNSVSCFFDALNRQLAFPIEIISPKTPGKLRFTDLLRMDNQRQRTTAIIVHQMPCARALSPTYHPWCGIQSLA